MRPRDVHRSMPAATPRSALRVLALLAVLLAVPEPAARAEDAMGGTWRGPVGRMRLEQSGQKLVGVLVEDSEVCPFRKGDRVLDGMLLLGNVSGKVRLCVLECGQAGERWAFSMLVRSDERLSGAAHVPGKGCRVPGRTAKGGVVFEREPDAPAAEDLPAGPALGKDTYDPRRAANPRETALGHARDGAQFLQEGRFEQARKRFEAAVNADPTYAEGYNGIGVTYALRRDWEQAVRWYKKSIEADPDLGDAYYNLACAYAQTSQPELAVRYLRLAVLNGYSTPAHLAEDPDLRPLHGRDDYQGILELGQVGAR